MVNSAAKNDKKYIKEILRTKTNSKNLGGRMNARGNFMS